MNLNIPILMYHQVSPNPHPSFLDYTVTPKTFETQMKILKMLGFKTISLDQLTAYRKVEVSSPGNPS